MTLKSTLFASALVFWTGMSLAASVEVAYLHSSKASAYLVENQQKKELKISDVKAPLGSLWKLFVHAYLLEKGERPGPYLCKGQQTEESFCCHKGEKIDLTGALAKSCGLYYEEKQTNIRDREWRSFWKDQHLPFTWLGQKQLRPETIVRVSELLESLNQLRTFKSFPTLKEHLFGVLSKGTLKDSMPLLGTQYFVKTWTWGESSTRNLIGGVAGWTQEGTSFWMKGQGLGREVMTQHASTLSRLLPRSSYDDAAQVRVHFFRKYALKKVIQTTSGQILQSGPLNGNIRIMFQNGNTLDFIADGSLQLHNNQLTGLFSQDEYVARVLEREALVTPIEAARAFSVLIRTYLFERGKVLNGKIEIEDSTWFQRVSPSVPSQEALNISRFTHDLILTGKSLNHGDEMWNSFKGKALNGKNFAQILESTFPKHQLVLKNDQREMDCRRLRVAERYLEHALKRWRRSLVLEPGHEEVNDVHVCELSFSRPFSDLRKNRIYLHFDESQEARVTLAHEYLHLAFKHHPRTSDERFIENLAQKLTGAFHD